jgi:hypothetical protein
VPEVGPPLAKGSERFCGIIPFLDKLRLLGRTIKNALSQCWEKIGRFFLPNPKNLGRPFWAIRYPQRERAGGRATRPSEKSTQLSRAVTINARYQ